MVGFTRLLLRGKFATSPTVSGYTWLELMLLSIAFADSPLSLVQSNTSHSHKALGHQIREFATAAVTVMKFMLKGSTANHVPGIHEASKQDANLWTQRPHHAHECACLIVHSRAGSSAYTHVVT